MVIPRIQFREFQQKGPLLFIFSSSPENRFHRMQMEQLDSIRLAIDDNRLMVVEIFENGQGRLGGMDLTQSHCNHLRERFGIHPGQFKVLLIGNDSEIHLISESCISWQELLLRVEDVSEFHIPVR